MGSALGDEMYQEGFESIIFFLKVRLCTYSRSMSGDWNFARVLCEDTLKSTKDT